MSDYRDLAKYLSKGFPQTPGSREIYTSIRAT
jgi:hypothetical protein